MDAYYSDRMKMVNDQLEGRGLRELRLLAAFRAVPRHLFVPLEYRQFAYDDGPLPIGYDQTISQPYIVAFMTHQLRLKGSEHVLEVGTGSGYQAAILSQLAADVHTVELNPDLYKRARMLILDLGYRNVHCHLADGSIGLRRFSPYNGIIVTAAAPNIPNELLEQLSNRGSLVLPVGGRGYQDLIICQNDEGRIIQRNSIGVAFVPLRGEHGWI